MILTTSYQKIGEVVIGDFGYGNVYLRLYGKYNEQSESGNSTTVQYQLRHYVPKGSITYYSSSQSFTGDIATSTTNSTNRAFGTGETALLTATKIITHNSNGTKSISVGGSFTNSYFGNTVSISDVLVELPTIPRESVLGTISDFTIGNSIDIPITKYSSSFTDTLEISLNGTTIKTISNITNGYDVDFTTSELNNIYGLLPSVTYGTFTFKLTTKSGSTTIGTSTQTSRGTIPTSMKPIISSITITEAGDVPSSWGVFVKNKSKLNFKISASASTGSSISSITSLVDGISYSGSEFTTNPINKSGGVFYEVRVTDSRDRPTSSTNTITFVDYDVPYITSASAIRCNSNGVESDNGTYLRVDLKAGVSSIESHNTSLYEVYYKKTTEDQWETHTLSSSGITYEGYALIPNIDINSSYDVQIKVTDYFAQTIKTLPTIPTAYATVDYLNGGHGVAIGKVAENADELDVALTLHTRGDVLVEGDVYGGDNHDRRLAFYDELGGTTLYENASGTNETSFEISETLADYKYVEVTYGNGSIRQVVKAPKLYAIPLFLSRTGYFDNSYYGVRQNTSALTIVDKKVTKPVGYTFSFNTGGAIGFSDTLNEIYIYKIVGYKY